MPNFLSKLFRKKKGGGGGHHGGPDEHSTNASKTSSKKSRKSTKKKGTKVDKIDSAGKPLPGKDTLKASPAQELRRPSNGTSNYSGSNSGSEPHVRVLSPRNNQGPNVMDHHNHHPHHHHPHHHHLHHRDPTNNELSLHSVNASGSHVPHLKQLNSNTSGGNGGSNNAWGPGPVDLDESDLGSDTDENQIQQSRSPRSPRAKQQHVSSAGLAQQHHHHHHQQQQQRLSVQQLDRFNMQQRRDVTAQFYMPKEELPKFSAGNVPVLDDMNRSDASSSSFNLSTDAEDTEYEALKRRGVVPNPTVLDSSHLSGISSPTNYNTDGDNSIFPALQTDDEGTLTERESNHGQPEGILPAKLPNTSSTTTGHDDAFNNRGNIHSTALSTQLQSKNSNRSPSEEEEERAWTISPTKDGAHPFPFHNPVSPTPRRNFTSPKLAARSPNSFSASVLSTSQNDTSNEFANFADFSNVTFPADTESWGAPNNHNDKASSKVLVDGTPPPVSPGRHMTHRSSSSAADMTLSDILAQAKGKRNSTSSHRSTGSGSRRVSSSSVNSAPAITAKYLRQHHNLRPGGTSRHLSDHGDGTTPVSDIIDSLEMANASRASSAAGAGGSTSKAIMTTSRTAGGPDQSRAAKDRVRERRRRENSSRRRSDPNHTTESSDGSDQEASESWLFDEVTGALGPRGIAADLESLSGRSKSSSGNKSHKSHRSHRSHRSHGRSRRRKSSSKHHPSSGESVDSRGSRHSRGSRYSHRSTRSYLSQMSEQSRSVANDLLRLEMQLAMVGSQDNNAAAAAAAAAGSSASVASRASRKSRSSTRRTVAIARRNKVTIQAPPGKLGIILANKADSKGTVVSGVRSSSVLSERISPGDRIVAIDGEDVSLMTVSEITTIMARKSDFERTLTVLTTPKHLSMPSTPSSSSAPAPPPTDISSARNSVASPKSAKDYDSYNRYHSR